MLKASASDLHVLQLCLNKAKHIGLAAQELSPQLRWISFIDLILLVSKNYLRANIYFSGNVYWPELVGVIVEKISLISQVFTLHFFKLDFKSLLILMMNVNYYIITGEIHIA